MEGRHQETHQVLDWVTLVLDSTTSGLEFWLGKNSEPTLVYLFIYKITEMEEVICRRNGLMKQVIEVKEGPLEFGSEEGNGKGLGTGKGEGKAESAPRRESALGPHPKSFKGGNFRVGSKGRF